MSVYELALTKDGPKRLVVRQPAMERGRWEVLLDGKQIAKLEPAEMLEGRTLTLEDGTSLRVRVEPSSAYFGSGHPLRVERDGALLRDCPVHPAHKVRTAAGALWMIGLLYVLCGAVVLVSPTERATAAVVLVEGLVYLGLAVAAQREKRWALVVGAVLAALDLIGGLVLLNVVAVLVRVAVLVPLVRGILAYRELANVDAASVADVFR